MEREEAINIVRKNIPHLGLGATEMTEALESLIPELRESEDERIRKCIGMALTDVDERRFKDFGVTLKDCLAYLERQKERIVEPHNPSGVEPYNMPFPDAQEYIEKRGFAIPWNDGDVFIDKDYITQTVANVLRWADEHPKEQKPAEWSEEDERKLEKLSFLLTLSEVSESITPTERTELGTFLQSLRPQPQWRPSEEQMEHLQRAKNSFSPTSEMYTWLECLYNDLLKLKQQ